MSSNIESMDQESSNSVQDESTNAHEQVQIAVTTSTTTSTSNTPSTSSSGSSSISSTTTTNTIDRKKRLFSKELRCMMYGFGDDQNPYTETVDMLEDLVIHFIGDIALRALEIFDAKDIWNQCNEDRHVYMYTPESYDWVDLFPQQCFVT
ncbi:hypothetical protein RDWZM_004676 [Blomia tropicalis]|uniref:Transcription initiation factor TFIID subunit 13 n=1 Tax=Blomia tropicalis TaxID=40697 RepID=A0A9Q0M4R9_BLOTA|nr:hypothetical protein RDWZM_004676 [Blomia tropicalis]